MLTFPQINSQRFIFPGNCICPLCSASLTVLDLTETQGNCISNEGPQMTLEPLAKATGHVLCGTWVRLSTQKLMKEGRKEGGRDKKGGRARMFPLVTQGGRGEAANLGRDDNEERPVSQREIKTQRTEWSRGDSKGACLFSVK